MNDNDSKTTRRGVLRQTGIVAASALAVQMLPPWPMVQARSVDAKSGESTMPASQEHTGRTAQTTKPGGARTYATLNPNNVVMLFADLQAGIIELAATNDLAHLRRCVSALAKLARLFAMPAIVTTAPSENGVHVTPEIASALGELPQYQRTTTDAFTHAATREAIAKTNRKVLLIAGVATEIIVQHSALSATAHGYEVQVVIDACGGLSTRTEAAALSRLTQAGVTLTSIASIAGQLAGDFTKPIGAQTLGILYEAISK